MKKVEEAFRENQERLWNVKGRSSLKLVLKRELKLAEEGADRREALKGVNELKDEKAEEEKKRKRGERGERGRGQKCEMSGGLFFKMK